MSGATEVVLIDALYLKDDVRDLGDLIERTGKKLTTTGHVSTDHKFRYLASIRDCKICPLKANCCPNMPQRRIMHDVNEDARDVARALMGTPEYEKSRDERKKVEMKFAHLKCHHGLERLRLRGRSGARRGNGRGRP